MIRVTGRDKLIRAARAASRRPVVTLVALVLVSCSASEEPRGRTFTTYHGLGPDKWASAWLLKRHVDPEAELNIATPGAPLPPGTTFDVEGALYERRADKSTFEVIREHHVLTDPVIEELATLIHAIEVEFWSKASNPEASVVEDGFRRLQQRYGRDRIVPECYLAYFDRVYQYLADSPRHALRPERRSLEVECTLSAIAATDSRLVAELPIADLLAELGRGRRIVFVDVREPEEFAEAHIPGAINLALRDVGPDTATRLVGADYVVSYCVKDFRGFEMARALQDLGVENAVILKPYGISGWVASGLPVAGGRAFGEAEAARKLAACAHDVGRCLGQ